MELASELGGMSLGSPKKIEEMPLSFREAFSTFYEDEDC